MRRAGFSMIELMIALGIIGILATLAIPRFLTYRMKAAQSEAKINLESLKQSQTLYYSETNGYTDDLSLLAWRPDGSPRYLYGFVTDERPVASGTNDTAELAAAGKGDYGTALMTSSFGVPLVDSDLPPGTGTSATGFTAGATANLDGDAALDHMMVDQRAIVTILQHDWAID